MTALRVLLAIMFVTIASYTGVVCSHHGMGLVSIFFSDMATMGWPGQFNLDFTCMLLLSGLWVSFRHRFSATGILLGICAVLLGATFLSVYLIVESLRAKGDVATLLLGGNGGSR